MGFLRITTLWKDGVIPYTFDSASAGDPDFVASVQAAMLEWMGKTEITFVPRTNESSYIRFRYDPSAPNCNSPVGDEGGERTLLCKSNDNWQVITHELGHTIGFIHEHQRPDRDKYVIVDSGAAKGDPYNILPVVPGKDIIVGDYDCNSVNHYPVDSFISPRPGGCPNIGSSVGASLGDIAAVRSVYAFVPSAGLLHQQSAISRGPNKLDLFTRWVNNGLYTAVWNGGEQWEGWWRIVNNQGLGVSPVTVVSRTVGTVDIFIRGTNNGIYTASWNGSQWEGWTRIVGGQELTLSPVSAVSRHPNKIDLFIRGTNNGIYTATMDYTGSNAKWQGWERIGNGVASSDVTAIARRSDTIDLFVLGVNRGIYTARWKDGQSSWQGWSRILDGVAMLGTSVAAVARTPNHLDLFVIGENRGIYRATWQERGDSWQGWRRILDGVVAPGTTVTAVSRTPDTIDLFVVGQDYRVWTTTWNSSKNGKWEKWEPVLNLKLAKRSAISAVSRTPDKLDLFVVGADGSSYTAAWDNGTWKGWWPVAPNS